MILSVSPLWQICTIDIMVHNPKLLSHINIWDGHTVV